MSIPWLYNVKSEKPRKAIWREMENIPFSQSTNQPLDTIIQHRNMCEGERKIYRAVDFTFFLDDCCLSGDDVFFHRCVFCIL